MSGGLQFDYTTVGHVTIDVLEDGGARPGGTALYSALQASRLGLRTLIHTRGVAREIEALLEPFAEEVELVVEPAPETTTLATVGEGSERRQRLLGWAGPIETREHFDSAILHLAPIAREISGDWGAHGGFLGLTPQGLAREWAGPNAWVCACTPEPTAVGLAGICDALVVNEQERASCAALIAATNQAGGLVAITDGPRPTGLLLPTGEELHEPTAALEQVIDDLGAGDVYASALFVALHEGQEPAAAAAFAGAAAAARMLGMGAQAIAGRAAILARLDR